MPFSKLKRDLPRGGNKMKLAAIEEEALPLAESVASKSKLPLGTMGGIAAGMLIPETAEAPEIHPAMNEAIAAKVKASLKNGYPSSLKGSPEMIDKDAPSFMPTMPGKSQKAVATDFLKELKRNFPDYKGEASINNQPQSPQPVQQKPKYKFGKTKIEGLENVDKAVRDEFKKATDNLNEDDE